MTDRERMLDGDHARVADRAGVSAKTVSRVVNDDRYVSADVRERVERAIDELQYVPNTLAVTFRRGRDAAIGVAVPGVADPFFASIIGAVEREASRRDVAVIVTAVGWEPSHEQQSIEAVLKRQVAGMIICPVGRDMSYLRAWQKRTPLVFVDREPGRLTADTVLQDDVGGGYDATGHRVSHGHRTIAFMGDDTRDRATAAQGVCNRRLRRRACRNAVLLERAHHGRHRDGAANIAPQRHWPGGLRRLPDRRGIETCRHCHPSGRR
jgi:LacI family transcriptional regulator